jgi:hypothetical protein
MKLTVIGFFTFIFITSCTRMNIILKENRYNYAEGTIIYDNNSNAVFIPKKINEKNIVFLKKSNFGDSVKFKSYYSREHVEISFLNKGNLVNQDSINVCILGKSNYPIGIVKVDFFNGDKIVSSYSPLDRNEKIFIQNITGFKVNVFGANSDFIQLNRNKLKDTLAISFDYLRPSEIEKYTFIDITIRAATPTTNINKTFIFLKH